MGPSEFAIIAGGTGLALGLELLQAFRIMTNLAGGRPERQCRGHLPGASDHCLILKLVPMPTDQIQIGRLTIPAHELEVRADRSSGPGGQHANKTASRITVVFDAAASPSLSDSQRERIVARCGAVVTASAEDARSQYRNRQLAFERLTAKLERALKPRKQRRATKPTKSSKKRRLEGKRIRGAIKQARQRPGGDD